jgi:hypothetical protein
MKHRCAGVTGSPFRPMALTNYELTASSELGKKFLRQVGMERDNVILRILKCQHHFQTEQLSVLRPAPRNGRCFKVPAGVHPAAAFTIASKFLASGDDPHSGRRREPYELGLGTCFGRAPLSPTRRRISLSACFSLMSDFVCAARSEACLFPSMCRFPLVQVRLYAQCLQALRLSREF